MMPGNIWIYFIAFWCVIYLNNFPLRVQINLSAIAALVSLEGKLYNVMSLLDDNYYYFFTFSI